MKRLSITLTAVLLAILFALQASVQVVGAASNTEYISEVKVFMAKEEADAKSALQSEGYTLLDCNLNQDAEGGVGSKGKKATYLGYKTTTNSAEAITDLAVMNMKGGYSTEDYESLMDQYINAEIEPFLKNFINAIKEYRTNYSSKYSANRTRATVIHDLLNKFKDDDTGQYLGDLLLNETKYEMGDDAYDALSDSEKKDHADLITIFAQANGQATLVIENLITRGSDTNEDTWIDRFQETTYDDLVESTGETPSDAKNTLAKKYDDDANTILDDLWDDFKEAMEGYDDAAANVESYDSSAYEEAIEALNSIDENTTDEEKEEIYDTFVEEFEKYTDYKDDLQTVTVYEMISEIDYEDGTLLDFFMQSSEDVEEDITVLYPMVASLTAGQRSGLDFVSLRELCVMAITDEDGYSESDSDIDDIPEASIYDGVDREIYEKGGVAVTSDALRQDAQSNMDDRGSMLSGTTIACWCITGVCLTAFAASAASWATYAVKLSNVMNEIKSELNFWATVSTKTVPKNDVEAGDIYFNSVFEDKPELKTLRDSYTSSSKLCQYLTIGFSVAVIVMAAISIWQTFKDLYDYYKVDLTPQPRYMVEETDITGYNKKGEKIVIKNQSAYYKIVETNRDESDSNYKNLGTGNDLNGDVGAQWLTLYAVRMEGKDPILASSLKTVTKSTDIPAGYETGIHMFGEDTAFNLNNTNYVWDDDAPSVFVYYKVDDSEASTSGSVFSAGVLALTGGLCLIAGAALTAIVMTVVRKKKEKKADVTA